MSIAYRIPRLPLEGNLDLTYRCNNACKHCWIWLPENSPKRKDELTFTEIRHLVDEARQMGTQRWLISGGEPMLHPEFSEIFDYITRKSVSYSINTNGTLITPEIAILMKRKGVKMVAMYGATADVHDDVTRTPGSFEDMMRGIAYLKEVGAGFMVQVVPMRDNFHQYKQMLHLAEELSPNLRIGAAWLYMSAYGAKNRNREIAKQRLEPRDVIFMDPPDVLYDEERSGSSLSHIPIDLINQADDRIFKACATCQKEFHVDPYGGMNFCSFVQDPELRYDLRKGNFHEGWESFIPSLADRVHGGQEYLENCGSCELRSDCRWCGAYGYLEQGRYSAPVPYLCEIARENRQFKENWRQNHRRYYAIAGITIMVESDLPFTQHTFKSVIDKFRVDGPGEDTVILRHHFELPEVPLDKLNKPLYQDPPWAVYRDGNSYLYLGISPFNNDQSLHRVAVFNQDYTRAQIFTPIAEQFKRGNNEALSFFPTDQIFLARVLADRQGCIFHASGMIINGQGFLFIGHSGAGKSTTMNLLRGMGEILCDDRIIIRRWSDGFRIHGTWSHGMLNDVSSSSAPLRAVMFLEKAEENRLIQIEDTRKIVQKLPFHVVKPLVSADWWEKTLDLFGFMAREIPFYNMRFDKSGLIKEEINRLSNG